MWQWPNYIQYRIELRKQSNAQRALDNKRPAETQENYENGALDFFSREDDDLFEWKRLIQTRYYRGKADSLLIQMPNTDDKAMYEKVEWDKDPKQPRYLTDEGLRVVRAAIREEQKHKREAVGYWFGIAVGVIGAITGLISAFR
ncbi:MULTISPECIES: hypothetical protein [unclassified Pseudomonas]|uniref:hypothetical protein n=1 Tax=unclassified Pseudomonas TaxID=196821 RepID=UPI000C88529D|nr:MULTISPECIES: hypothetical protein [unclassified Pseudomonas]PMZ87023.1 hypothetical protein C1X61_20320 [Pseudomonas sp. FW215-T2]PNA09276.1 hypothetical protein C1X62_22350 [Pseudomonas sp. FW215-R3]PNB35708.1 hypothetical protein C1X63_21510 [Pseudomonas sp. FW305-131]